MKSVLITGANRGIGLGLVRKFLSLSNPPKYIFATCRYPFGARHLEDIAQEYKSVCIIAFDVTDSKGYKKLVETVTEKLGDEGLSCLINNAGQISTRGQIEEVDEEELVEVYKVNTVAPIMLTKAFLPLLRKAAKESSDEKVGAVVINISSLVGSITDNTTGGLYGYRCSKTALNMATKSMSIDLKDDGITVVSIHPGWVKTDMGGPYAKISVKESVTALVKTIMSLKPKDSGTFIGHRGEVIPF